MSASILWRRISKLIRLHMLHSPSSLESDGFSIHQGANSRSPHVLAADSNVASSEFVV